MESLVSVILPIYNAEKYLAECLDSIFDQTYDNYELVCVNDGSTDRSAKILKDYNVDFITTKNRGEAKARNEAIKRAKGKYLCIMDADDVMYTNRIEKSVNAIKNCDVVYSGYMAIDEEGLMKFFYNPPAFTRENFKINQVIPHPTMMIRKDKMIPYRDYKFSCDFALIWDLVKKGCRFKDIGSPTLMYRLNSGSMTSRTKQQEKDKYKNKILREIKNESIWVNPQR